MKNITKKIIAVFAVLCVAATSMAGCGDKKKKGSDEAITQYALEVGKSSDGESLTLGNTQVDLNAPDPETSDDDTSSADNKTSAKEEEVVEEVTDSKGQPVTEVVTVTDASGETVTDAKGETVTETVKVTTVVKKPSSSGNSGNNNSTTPSKSNGNNNDNNNNNSNYTAANDGRYFMWLDISKNENFYFEGDMLKMSFKVKENIPDGDYKIRVTHDLSSIAGVSLNSTSKSIDGTIRVNNGDIEPADVSGETGMVLYGDNIACKQGDTIDYYINIKNNEGLAAFCIWVYFDSNALEFIEDAACASGEFEEIAYETEIGSSKKKKSE